MNVRHRKRKLSVIFVTVMLPFFFHIGTIIQLLNKHTYSINRTCVIIQFQLEANNFIAKTQKFQLVCGPSSVARKEIFIHKQGMSQTVCPKRMDLAIKWFASN